MAFLFNRDKKQNVSETRIVTHEPATESAANEIRWDSRDLEGGKTLEPQPAFTGFNSPPGRF
jgi:hypothetical protein